MAFNQFYAKLLHGTQLHYQELGFFGFFFFYKKISSFIGENHVGIWNTSFKSNSKSFNHASVSSKLMFIYVLGNKIMIDLNADCKTDFFFSFLPMS